MKKWPLLLTLSCTLVLISGVVGYSLFKSGKELRVTELIEAINSGSVSEMTVAERRVDVVHSDGQHSYLLIMESSNVIDLLLKLGVSPTRMNVMQVRFSPSSALYTTMMALLLVGLAAIVSLIVWGVVAFFSKQLDKRGISESSTELFTRSRAQEINAEDPKVAWGEVAGGGEARKTLQELSLLLENPDRLKNVGGRFPRGIMLVGLPGTGKTLMARAVASAAQAKFFRVAGSEFVELYVGVGAARVRDLFESARKYERSIIFIDEIDAFSARSNSGSGSQRDTGNSESVQTLNQLLIEMDGFSQRDGMIVIGATNRLGQLDPALLRAGRFDFIIQIDLPDFQERKQIWTLHGASKCMNTEEWTEKRIEAVASRSDGLTGADIESVMNQAAWIAAVRADGTIQMSDVEQALNTNRKARGGQSEPRKHFGAFPKG